MPKHIHILKENIYGIPIGTAVVTNTEANDMIDAGIAIEVPSMPLPTPETDPTPTIIVQQQPAPAPKPIKKRKDGPMKKPKFSNLKNI